MNLHDTVFAHQVGVSFLLVYILQWLKARPWFPWVSKHSDQLNRTIALVVAFLTSFGLQFTIAGSALQGLHIGIDIPSLGALTSTIVHFAAQAGMQEGIYKGMVRNGTAEKVLMQAAAKNAG